MVDLEMTRKGKMYSVISWVWIFFPRFPMAGYYEIRPLGGGACDVLASTYIVKK